MGGEISGKRLKTEVLSVTEVDSHYAILALISICPPFPTAHLNPGTDDWFLPTYWRKTMLQGVKLQKLCVYVYTYVYIYIYTHIYIYTWICNCVSI